MTFFKTKYRIVTDRYLVYQVDQKVWFWPFWCEVDGGNTHRSEDEAEGWLCAHLRRRKRVVKYLGAIGR
jgi:hypothetical protein